MKQIWTKRPSGMVWRTNVLILLRLEWQGSNPRGFASVVLVRDSDPPPGGQACTKGPLTVPLGTKKRSS